MDTRPGMSVRELLPLFQMSDVETRVLQGIDSYFSAHVQSLGPMSDADIAMFLAVRHEYAHRRQLQGRRGGGQGRTMTDYATLSDAALADLMREQLERVEQAKTVVERENATLRRMTAEARRRVVSGPETEAA